MQKKKYLNFVPFSSFDKWYVSYYINPYSIKSNYKLEFLSNIITPLKEKIKKLDYKGDLPVISKISFADGKIHLRDEKQTGMDLYKLNLNDLLVSKINFHQGAVAINKIGDLVCSTHYQPYKINYSKINPDYLILVIRSNVFKDFLSFLRADGIKNEATYEFIGSLQIPLPSLEEQRRIVAAFNENIKAAEQFDSKAKELENSIEKYLFGELGMEFNSNSSEKSVGKFIKVYKYSAFDKWGANRNTTNKLTLSKPHLIKRIKEICSVSSGGTPSRDRKEYYKGNIPWIKTGEVINGIIYDTEEKITKEAIENSSAKIYPKNSLIIAMYGQGLTRGRTAKLGIDASTNQACAVLFDIDNSIILTDYLWIYLMGEYDRLRELASGNSQPNLNAQMIKDYNVIIPSLEMQSTIVNNINSFRVKINEFKQLSRNNKEKAIIEFEKAIFN